MRRISGWLIALSGISLASCVSVQQQATTTPSSSAHTVIVARVPSPHVIDKIVAAGTSVTLTAASSVNPDCSLMGIPTVRVMQAPVHGNIKLLHHDVFPRFPQINPRSKCNDKKMPGVVAIYTPDTDFIGSDFAEVEVFFPDGKADILKFSISVK